MFGLVCCVYKCRAFRTKACVSRRDTIPYRRGEGESASFPYCSARRPTRSRRDSVCVRITSVPQHRHTRRGYCGGDGQASRECVGAQASLWCAAPPTLHPVDTMTGAPLSQASTHLLFIILLTSSVFSVNPISRPMELSMPHMSPARPPMIPPTTIDGRLMEGWESAPAQYPIGSDTLVKMAQSRMSVRLKLSTAPRHATKGRGGRGGTRSRTVLRGVAW